MTIYNYICHNNKEFVRYQPTCKQAVTLHSGNRHKHIYLHQMF